MKILCLSARFPYPPLKGDQVILYNRLKRLSRRHEITLLTFWRGDADAEFLDAVRPHCREVVTVRHNLAGALLNLAKGVYTLLPFQVLLFRSGRFEREAARLIGSGGFDIVHAYMLRTAEYAKEARQPRVLDMIDAMHRNYERRGATERWFLREAFREEARRLKAYENSVADRFDASIFVSREDAETISSGRRLAIPLGVDTDQFNGNGGARTGGTILFSGSLYLLSLTGTRWLGAITPFGGVLLLCGWASLAIGVARGG